MFAQGAIAPQSESGITLDLIAGRRVIGVLI
jgi:hypothetical protein